MFCSWLPMFSQHHILTINMGNQCPTRIIIPWNFPPNSLVFHYFTQLFKHHYLKEIWWRTRRIEVYNSRKFTKNFLDLPRSVKIFKKLLLLWRYVKTFKEILLYSRFVEILNFVVLSRSVETFKTLLLLSRSVKIFKEILVLSRSGKTFRNFLDLSRSVETFKKFPCSFSFCENLQTISFAFSILFFITSQLERSWCVRPPHPNF